MAHHPNSPMRAFTWIFQESHLNILWHLAPERLSNCILNAARFFAAFWVSRRCFMVINHDGEHGRTACAKSILPSAVFARRCWGFLQGCQSIRSFMYCKFIVLEDFIHKCNAKVEGPGCSKSFMYSFLAKLQMSRSSQSQHKFHDT